MKTAKQILESYKKVKGIKESVDGEIVGDLPVEPEGVVSLEGEEEIKEEGEEGCDDAEEVCEKCGSKVAKK